MVKKIIRTNPFKFSIKGFEMQKIILLIIIATCVSCHKSSTSINNANSASEKIVIDSIKHINFIAYSDLFEDVKFIKLETCDESLIGRIDKVLYYDRKFFILDQIESKSVFVFDEYGKFLRKIGSSGMGPGEFEEPNEINIDEFLNQIVVYNNSKRALQFYSLAGEFVGSLVLDYYIKSFYFINKDLIALYLDNINNGNLLKGSKSNLLIINRKGNIVKSYFEVPDNNFIQKGGFNFFSSYCNKALLSPGYSDAIYSIDGDTVALKYTIDFGKMEILESFFLNKTTRAFDSEIRGSNYAFLNDFYETPDYLCFSFI
jgi:hypothetical protein